MATNIKGITIEIGGNTTKLNKALNATNSSIMKTSRNLSNINRLLKFNPTSTALLKQKQEQLGNQVIDTRNKLETLKEAQRQLGDRSSLTTQKQIDEYDRLDQAIIEQEGYLKHYQQELRRFGSVGAQQVAAVGRKMQAMGTTLKTLGTKITTTAGLLGGLGVVFGKKAIAAAGVQSSAEKKLEEIYRSRLGLNKDATKSTKALAKEMQKYGVVSDEVTLGGAQQLATFAKQKSTVETLMPAMANLLVQQKGLKGTQQDAVGIANLMGKVLNGQTGALKRVGISFTAAQEKTLKYGTEQEKAAVLAQVITDNVGEMNKKFASTPAGKIQQVKNNLNDLSERIGAMLLPVIQQVADYINTKVVPVLEKVISYLEKNPELVNQITKWTIIITILGPILVILGSIISAVGTILSIVPAIVGAVQTVIGVISGLAGGTLVLSGGITALLAPILGVVAGIAALIAIGVLLWKNWDGIMKRLSGLAAGFNKFTNGVMTKATTALNGLKTKIGGAFTSIVTKINSFRTRVATLFDSIKDKITSPITKAVELIKKIFPISVGKVFSNLKLPKFRVEGGKAPFGIGGKGKKPEFHIDFNKKAMQLGRVLDGAQIFGQDGNGNLLAGGEAGKEWIIGQNSILSMINNAVGRGMTNAADNIVNGINAAIGGNGATGQPIVINTYLYPNSNAYYKTVYQDGKIAQRRFGR